MKTKRRACVVAGVVVACAVAVCLAAWSSDAWLFVAYERDNLNEFLYYERRWSWFPGDKFKVLPQPCLTCNAGEHDICMDVGADGNYVDVILEAIEERGFDPLGESHTELCVGLIMCPCTCTHPSHKDKP